MIKSSVIGAVFFTAVIVVGGLALSHPHHIVHQPSKSQEEKAVAKAINKIPYNDEYDFTAFTVERMDGQSVVVKPLDGGKEVVLKSKKNFTEGNLVITVKDPENLRKGVLDIIKVM